MMACNATAHTVSYPMAQIQLGGSKYLKLVWERVNLIFTNSVIPLHNVNYEIVKIFTHLDWSVCSVWVDIHHGRQGGKIKPCDWLIIQT